jgi:2-desacetyl-2-hydroxyethyl bacteriochlorophyllide A dehydrogenase
MRALVKKEAAPGGVELREMPVPQIGEDEVLLELIYGGLCRTDVSFVEWNAAAQATYRPNFPQIIGHEYLGRVVASGPGSGLPVGSRVVGSGHVVCGACPPCLAGRSMLCQRLKVLGLDVNGVFAERFVVPQRNVAIVPDEVPDTVAALAEPFAVGLHALKRGSVQPGMKVAVVGPGSVGLMTIAALGAERGVSTTAIGTEADLHQLELASSMGVDEIRVVGRDTDKVAGTFDVVFETAGHASAVSLAVELAAPGGTVVCVGLPAHPVEINSGRLAMTEKSLVGARAHDISDWKDVPQMLARATGLAAIDVKAVGLDELDHAIHLTATRQASKVLLAP